MNDGSLESITSDIMISSIETELESMVEEDLDFTLIDEQFIEVDGHKTFKYSFKYEIQGVSILQTQYMIENGDEYEFLTFSDFDEGYTDIFNECMNTLEYLSDSEIEEAIVLEEIQVEENNQEMSSEWINFDNMQFSINDKTYTMGKTTLQELIDDGVPFDEDDIVDAGNNVKPSSQSNGFKIHLGEYWSAQVYVSNFTEEHSKACDLPITEIYLPNKPEETQDILKFAFPLDLTEEELIEKCGEPTTTKFYKSEDSDFFSNDYNYTKDSTMFFADWGYKFNFDNDGLAYLTLDWMP